MPHWMPIIGDDAYSPLSAECNGQILTPYSQHQLNAAKQKDWKNDRIRRNTLPTMAILQWISLLKITEKCEHVTMSSAVREITIERVLGMMVRQFGILWRPMEYNLAKAPKIFRVVCKLHNLCI
jgi:hypothetical protein